MQDYQRRALPSDLEKARSLYQTWLLSLVKDAGFQDAQVGVLPARSEKGVYDVAGVLGQRPGRSAEGGDVPAPLLFGRFAAPRAARVRQARAGHQAAGPGVFDRCRLAARRRQHGQAERPAVAAAGPRRLGRLSEGHLESQPERPGEQGAGHRDDRGAVQVRGRSGVVCRQGAAMPTSWTR